MAEKRTINIDINNNADEAAKDFENFAKATNTANDSVEGLNKTFEEVYGEIQPLTTRMGEAEDRLYELAAAGDTTSKEYQQLLSKVGEYRKVQIQTDLAVDQAAGTLSQKLGSALTGATSGFAAVQGVMALTGGESEALEKSLLKVQGAMAIQQGVQGILDYSKSVGLASKATKVFNAILSLNPLALLGTALVGVITYITLFTDAIEEALGYWNDFTDFIGVTNHAEEELAEERKKRHREQFERQKAEQTLRDAEIKQLEALGKSTIKLRRQQVEADLAALKSSQEFFDQSFKVLAEIQGEEFKRSATGIEKQAQIIALETQLLELDKEQETVNKANSEKAQARRDKKKEDLEEIAKLEQEALDKEIEEEIALQQAFDAIQRENEDRSRTEKENELLLVKEKYDALEASAFGNKEALKEIEIARLNERNDILFKYDTEAYDAKKAIDDQAAADQKVLDEQAIANAKTVADTKKAIIDAEFSNIEAGLNLAKSLFGDNKKLQAAALIAENAVGIAKTIINTQTSNAATTAQGAALALTTGGASVAAASALVLQNNIAAGISVAASVAATAKGLSALGVGGDTGGGDVPASSGGGGGSVPQFNVVGDSGVNQLAQLQQQPTQAFVVSGEVTTAQALDRNRVQNATL